jgi:predicted amidophosphoribosyltransferase
VELAFEPQEEQEQTRQHTPTENRMAARNNGCPFCGGDLPADRLIKFCPHCGNDLSRRPCSKCGEILDPKWRFCVNCGAPSN